MNVSTADVYMRFHRDDYIQFWNQSRRVNDTCNCSSSDGQNRVFYTNNSTTYLTDGNSQDSSFVFRRSNDDGQLGFITSGGFQ